MNKYLTERKQTVVEDVYDILNCGPRARFMANGFLVHNSGGEKLNTQNFARGGALRQSLTLPDGWTMMACDLSQIEARVNAYVAGQHDTLNQFRDKKDIYCEFGSKLYGRTITKADKAERMMGKTCFASDTLVLTDTGWKCIVDVSIADKVWDGLEWVTHEGILTKGKQHTVSAYGVTATPDHDCWIGNRYVNWLTLATDSKVLKQALCSASLPYSVMPDTLQNVVEDTGGNPMLGAPVAGKDVLSEIILRLVRQHDAILVQKLKQLIPDGLHTKTHYQMTSIGKDYSIGYQQLLVDALTQTTEDTSLTAVEVLLSMMDGDMTEQSFLNIARRYLTGMNQRERLTVLMLIKDTCRGILDLLQKQRTVETNALSTNSLTESSSSSVKSKDYEQKLQSYEDVLVYDIVNAGPRHRYTILSVNGPIIVSNCVLALGYGMGAAKFKDYARLSGVVIDEQESERVVSIYRSVHNRIKDYWSRCDMVLSDIVNGKSGWIYNLLPYDHRGIKLPNGLFIRYPLLRRLPDGKRGFRFVNEPRMYTKVLAADNAGKEPEGIRWTYQHGAKTVENITQALARIVVTEMMNVVSKRYKILFQVHDEIVIACRDNEVKEASEFLSGVMSTAPKWAPDLPVDCECSWGKNYKECK